MGMTVLLPRSQKTAFAFGPPAMALSTLSRRPPTFAHLLRPAHRSAHGARLPNPTKLHGRSATVHLLGTMHIAEASATAARDLIHKQHAKGTLGAVFLELDEARHARLAKSMRGNPDDSLLSHALSTLARAQRDPLAALVELALTTLYRTLHQLGFASGVEFRAAIDIAKRLDIPLVLGDQHISVTTSRLAEAFRQDLDLPRLLSLAMTDSRKQGNETSVERTVREAFQSVASGDVEGGQARFASLLNSGAIREIIAPMHRYVPNVANAILHERDVVMADNLVTAVDKLPLGKKNLVAVVGLAHMEGIAREWENRVLRDEKVSAGPP